MAGQPLHSPAGELVLERAEEDKLAQAVGQVLHEMQAALRDLRLTSFSVQQAEALRRVGRARTKLAHFLESRARGRLLNPRTQTLSSRPIELLDNEGAAFQSLRAALTASLADKLPTVSHLSPVG